MTFDSIPPSFFGFDYLPHKIIPNWLISHCLFTCQHDYMEIEYELTVFILSMLLPIKEYHTVFENNFTVCLEVRIVIRLIPKFLRSFALASLSIFFFSFLPFFCSFVLFFSFAFPFSFLFSFPFPFPIPFSFPFPSPFPFFLYRPLPFFSTLDLLTEYTHEEEYTPLLLNHTSWSLING